MLDIFQQEGESVIEGLKLAFGVAKGRRGGAEHGGGLGSIIADEIDRVEGLCGRVYLVAEGFA